ncbi:ABC transporter substrate-binding protein [Desulforhabdus amnigena]|jgi:branched-chain amino acid transport system substrate-binding protein|uniref:Branched-chain amino acid ABC transporter substrate-binding protein n=1 Tax=Desulforhabdus amnigena TaxID=40218 RepID=A0A9W6FRT9_9BACT|nr:ABC transporter substrate-binding protein [Desulforhabdus amnigena]NLJ28370.1 ABC transporter substrate-binding protein [Deltaproteobacteria bacterium]GLI33349.1 branched-chain amino acid ABC transporter substrate-binding protein [Desulforhabdus amnigena]
MGKKNVLTLLVVISILFSFSSMPVLAEDVIKLGAYLPMTGSVAAYGDMEWSGIQIAKEMEPEVLGKKVEVMLVDTKSDKIEAANAVTLLVEKEKVVGVLGEAISGNTMAGNPISEAAKIPSVSPTATNPLVNQGKNYAFRACFIDPFQGEVAARFARSELKAQTAAVIIDIAQDYCVGLGNFFVKEFVKQGGKIVSTTYIQTGDQDFSAQLSAVQSTKPDIIYAPNYYTEDALMAKQARDLGINQPILTGDGAQADALIEIGGASVENMYFTAHFHKQAASTDRAKEYIKRYEEKYKKDADAFGALGADAYFLLVDAIKRAGSTDGTKVRDALAATKDFKGVSGTLTMGENGNPIKSMVINKVENGKFVYVTTINP